MVVQAASIVKCCTNMPGASVTTGEVIVTECRGESFTHGPSVSLRGATCCVVQHNAMTSPVSRTLLQSRPDAPTRRGPV